MFSTSNISSSDLRGLVHLEPLALREEVIKSVTLAIQVRTLLCCASAISQLIPKCLCVVYLDGVHALSGVGFPCKCYRIVHRVLSAIARYVLLTRVPTLAFSINSQDFNRDICITRGPTYN